MKKIISLICSLGAVAMLFAACDSGVEEWHGSTNKPNKPNPTPVTPSGDKWAALADSTTNVLITNFLDKTTGTFWATPRDMEKNSQYIYWQQAHAMDVVLWSYQRIKDSNPDLAATYKGYFAKWFDNDANNYNNSHDSEGNYGGFFNDWTDDMAWICITLLRMTEFTGDDLYAQASKDVFDNYIWTRSTKCSKGVCLPWTNHDEDKNNFNACTNTPACLVAGLLYQKFNEPSYLKIAQDLYEFNVNNMPDAERVEEPPLAYTQGTFGEACRILYHITGEKSYMDKAGKVLLYAFNGNRTTNNGLLRDEGHSMDQSIFKAGLLAYAANYVLDEGADKTTALAMKEKLIQNANALDQHMDRNMYPQMYANYYWGETVETGKYVIMGAQASGAALMEAVARLTEK